MSSPALPVSSSLSGRRPLVLADLVPENSDGGFAAADLAALEELAADTPPLRDLASRIHVMARRPAQR